MRTLFLRSWWLFLFFMICSAGYYRGARNLENEHIKLSQMYSELQNKKIITQKTQENLILQIKSQEDYDWKELTLMRVLGLTPEETTKIVFQ